MSESDVARNAAGEVMICEVCEPSEVVVVLPRVTRRLYCPKHGQQIFYPAKYRRAKGKQIQEIAAGKV